MQRFLQENMKKNNTWNIRRLVDESFVPANQWSSVLYWRLSYFSWCNQINTKAWNSISVNTHTDWSCIISITKNESLYSFIQFFECSVIVDLVDIMYGKGQKLRIYHLVSLRRQESMNLADAQPGVFKMNLDAHLVCHLATTETWVHDKPESNSKWFFSFNIRIPYFRE